MNEQLNHLVTDIETIPDETIPQPENDSFPPGPCHQIIAISILHITNTGIIDFRSVNHGDVYSEKALLRNYTDFLYKSTITPTIVTWGGRGFDLPVMLYRSMKHNLAVPKLASAALENRFRHELHLDLQDRMTMYRSSTPFSLHKASRLVGLKGKSQDIDGSKVHDYFLKGKIKRIRSYCSEDVGNTTIILLKWLHTIGNLEGIMTRWLISQVEERMKLL